MSMIPKKHAHILYTIMLMILGNHEHDIETSCAWNFEKYFY